MLDAGSNTIVDLKSDGIALKGGVMLGDCILAVNDEVVTSIDWRPTATEGVVVCRLPVALAPAGSALDPSKPAISLKILRPVEMMAAASAPEEPPVPAPEVQPVPAAPVPAPAPAPYMAAEQPAATMPSAPANALEHYPWATQINTAQDGIKNKYNIARGTTLKPLQPLQRLDAAATMRKTSAYAAPRGRELPPRR